MKKVFTVIIGITIGLLSLNTAHATPVNQTILKNTHDTIEIIMANFGSRDKRCDAKAIVSKACDRKTTCVLPVMREICGSTSSNDPRELTVLYACQEKSYTVSEREDRAPFLRLSCNL